MQISLGLCLELELKKNSDSFTVIPSSNLQVIFIPIYEFLFVAVLGKHTNLHI